MNLPILATTFLVAFSYARAGQEIYCEAYSKAAESNFSPTSFNSSESAELNCDEKLPSSSSRFRDIRDFETTCTLTSSQSHSSSDLQHQQKIDYNIKAIAEFEAIVVAITGREGQHSDQLFVPRPESGFVIAFIEKGPDSEHQKQILRSLNQVVQNGSDFYIFTNFEKDLSKRKYQRLIYDKFSEAMYKMHSGVVTITPNDETAPTMNVVADNGEDFVDFKSRVGNLDRDLGQSLDVTVLFGINLTPFRTPDVGKFCNYSIK